MEQVIDWLNENELRAYPLQEETQAKIVIGADLYDLPQDFLIDLQLKAPVSLQPGSSVNPVYLKRISYVSTTTLAAHFGMEGTDIASFNVTLTEYPLYVRTVEGNLAVFGAGVATFLSWCNIQNITPRDINIHIPVEPSTCIQFNDAWLGVNSLQGSPGKQTRQDSFEPVLPLVGATTPPALTGDVKFLAGYNFRVAIAGGALDLEISNSHGLHMSCNTSFIADQYLDCADLVSYINGIPADPNGNFRLANGANIAIVSGNSVDLSSAADVNLANQHTLYVGLTFQATDLCAPVNLTPEVT